MTSPITISLNPTETYGQPISSNYFGINFIFDYERIGSRPWERFDEVVDAVGAQGIRYPGGVAAETAFDITNPDANTYVDADGATHKVMPLSEFLAYCGQTGVNPTIIIPTHFALTTGNVNGHRDFDEQWADEIVDFIKFVIAKTDPALLISFEIGNEYWGYMTAVEYGRVASAITGLIEQAIDEYSAENDLPQEWQHPQIYIQVQADSPNGGFSQEQLITKNLNVLAEFDTIELAAVDGVVSHFYYSENSISPNSISHSIDNIVLILQDIAQLHDMWSTAAGREIASRMSEWNVHHQSAEDFGLQQIPILMEMLSEFAGNGFDVLDFWSTQYHATSLAASNGSLMAAGIIFDYAEDLLVGAVGIDVDFAGDEVEVVAFQSGDQIIVFASSMTAEPLELSFQGADFLPLYQLVSETVIGVDESTADGVYRNHVGLPVSNEPDVTFTTETVVPDQYGPPTFPTQLGGYETAILIFEMMQVGDVNGIVGTTGDDLLIASEDTFVFDGLSGNDTVSFSDLPSGVTIDLTNGINVTGSQFQLTSIEGLIGTEFSDVLYGNDNGISLVGAGGDDSLYGGAGNDTIAGGDGNDTIVGFDGDDILRGDGGDDLLVIGAGLDMVNGGDGIDTVDFSGGSGAVAIWLLDGIVESKTGEFLVESVESAIGSVFDDVISGGFVSGFFDGGAGNDDIRIFFGDGNIVSGGTGNDLVRVFGGSAVVYGGEGDDVVFSYSSADFFGGAGDDWFYGGPGSEVIDGGLGNDTLRGGGGADEFLFSEMSGHDVILDFQVGEDIAFFDGSDNVEVQLLHTQSGSLIEFGEASSVLLESIFVSDLQGILEFV
jgi:Ca2+-binding RTX toxin-like protein